MEQANAAEKYALSQLKWTNTMGHNINLLHNKLEGHSVERMYLRQSCSHNSR